MRVQGGGECALWECALYQVRRATGSACVSEGDRLSSVCTGGMFRNSLQGGYTDGWETATVVILFRASGASGRTRLVGHRQAAATRWWPISHDLLPPCALKAARKWQGRHVARLGSVREGQSVAAAAAHECKRRRGRFFAAFEWRQCHLRRFFLVGTVWPRSSHGIKQHRDGRLHAE